MCERDSRQPRRQWKANAHPQARRTVQETPDTTEVAASGPKWLFKRRRRNAAAAFHLKTSVGSTPEEGRTKPEKDRREKNFPTSQPSQRRDRLQPLPDTRPGQGQGLRNPSAPHPPMPSKTARPRGRRHPATEGENQNPSRLGGPQSTAPGAEATKIGNLQHRATATKPRRGTKETPPPPRPSQRGKCHFGPDGSGKRRNKENKAHVSPRETKRDPPPPPKRYGGSIMVRLVGAPATSPPEEILPTT